MELQRALWAVLSCLLLSVRMAHPSYVPVGQTCSVGNLAYFKMSGYTLKVAVSDADQVQRHTPETCQQACRDHTAFDCVSYAHNNLISSCALYKYRPGEGGAVLQVPSPGDTSYTYYVSYCKQTAAPTGSLSGCHVRDLNVVSPSFSFTSINKMTPQYCHQYCLYFTRSTYSGVWGGSNCYCGETLASGAAIQLCSSPCTGDGAQTCGGPNSMQVYAACDSKKFGANCDQSCNCVDQDVCPRTTGACTKPCPAGYGGISCQEQDECQDKTALCSDLCQNTVGSYTCSCPTGKKLKADGHTCQTEACPVGKWGAGCGSDCNANCKGGTCAPDTGKCTQCIEGYTGDTCMDTGNAKQTPNSGSDINIPIVAGGAAGGALLLIIIIIVVVVCVRRRKNKNPNKEDNPMEMNESEPRNAAERADQDNHDPYVFDNSVVVVPVAASEDKRVSASSKRNSELMDKRKSAQKKRRSSKKSAVSILLRLDELPKHIEKLKKNNDKGLLAEYQKIPNDQRGTYEIAKAVPKEHNKFKNILAYDHSRVILEKAVSQTGEMSDYINANFIKTPNEEDDDKFIGSQGPQAPTVDAFWRMVWETESNIIVMLTNPMELGKIRCEDYWPRDGPNEYGKITVTPVNVEKVGEFAIRTFKISLDGEQRPVKQFHYVRWPDHGVPDSPTGLLKMHKMVRDGMLPDKHVVVHCSAGVGRTGTFISIDQLLIEAERTGHVDVPGTINKLRDSRDNMVQTPGQYMFIYEALVEASTLDSTSLSCSSLLELVDSESGIQAWKKEYQYLRSTTREPTKTELSDALRPENLSKNRSKTFIPANRNRVFLTPEKGQSDYISAGFVDGYQRLDEFVATQVPLRDTVSDFWQMMLDYESGHIVILESDEVVRELCPNFLPARIDETITIGQFHVTLVGIEELDVIRILNLAMIKGSDDVTKHIYQNTLVESPSSGVTKHSHIRVILPNSKFDSNFTIKSFDQLKKWQKDQGNNTPTVVVGRDGVTRCGVYLAASLIFHMIQSAHNVDVFYSVRSVKRDNPYFIITEEQYLYLYDIAAAYLRTFPDLCNFT